MTQRRIIQNEYPYLLTTNVRGGELFFKDAGHAKALAKVIRTTCELKHFALLAYCIVPEHVHIIVAPLNNIEVTAGRAARARGAGKISTRPERPAVAAGIINIKFTVSDLMHGIKSYFIHALRTGRTNIAFAWQPRFNSRVLNSEDYLRTAIEYVLYNPKKVGLPVRYCKQPYMFVDNEQVNSLFYDRGQSRPRSE